MVSIDFPSIFRVSRVILHTYSVARRVVSYANEIKRIHVHMSQSDRTSCSVWRNHTVKQILIIMSLCAKCWVGLKNFLRNYHGYEDSSHRRRYSARNLHTSSSITLPEPYVAPRDGSVICVYTYLYGLAQYLFLARSRWTRCATFDAYCF